MIEMTLKDPQAIGSAEDVCPTCDAPTVRVIERGWFSLALDRAGELRDAEALHDEDLGVEFSCRSCGAGWH